MAGFRETSPRTARRSLARKQTCVSRLRYPKPPVCHRVVSLQGSLKYASVPSVPATDIFYIHRDTGQIRIRNSTLLKLDKGFTYRVGNVNPSNAHTHTHTHIHTHKHTHTHTHTLTHPYTHKHTQTHTHTHTRIHTHTHKHTHTHTQAHTHTHARIPDAVNIITMQ